MHQDILNLIRLLDLNADAHAIDGRLDEHAFVLVARDGQGVQEDFRGGLGFDFGYVVPFGGLGCKIGEAEGGGEGGPHALEVRS